MKKLIATKRRKIILGVAVLAAAVGGGAAIAYYTLAGQGSTSGQVHISSATSYPLSFTSLNTSGSLSPGGATVNITGAMSAAGASGPVSVNSIVLDSSQGQNGIGGLPAGCQREWFTIGSDTTGWTLADGWTPFSVPIAMANQAVDQTSCAGHDITVYLVAT